MKGLRSNTFVGILASLAVPLVQCDTLGTLQYTPTWYVNPDVPFAEIKGVRIFNGDKKLVSSYATADLELVSHVDTALEIDNKFALVDTKAIVKQKFTVVELILEGSANSEIEIYPVDITLEADHFESPENETLHASHLMIFSMDQIVAYMGEYVLRRHPKLRGIWDGTPNYWELEKNYFPAEVVEKKPSALSSGFKLPDERTAIRIVFIDNSFEKMKSASMRFPLTVIDKQTDSYTIELNLKGLFYTGTAE